MRNPDLHEETNSALAEVPSPGASQPYAGFRILVADDTMANYLVAVRMLEQLGCRAEVAASGQEAVAMQRRRHYDLVLMDCQMPGLDGLAATERIRSAETGALRTPIIGWTTGDTALRRAACLAAGMDDLIEKPVRFDILQAVLAAWLPGAANRAMPVFVANDGLEEVRQLLGPGFAEIAALFRTDTPARLDQLRAAAAQRDSAQMTRLAHAVAGSCASIGADRMHRLCSELEAQCRHGIPANHATLLAELRTEYTRFEARLISLLFRNEGARG